MFLHNIILTIFSGSLLDKPKAMSLTDPHHPWHHPAAAAAAISAAAAQQQQQQQQQQHAQDQQQQQQQQHGRGSTGEGSGEKSGFFGSLGRASGSGGAGGPHHGNPFLAAAAAQHSAMGLGPLGSLGAKAEQLRTSMAAQQHSGMAGTQPAPFR